MWPIFLLVVLLVCLLGWFVTARAQTRRVHALERSKEEIQVEETLVFDFLHGLGAAFTETIRPADLHRLIVEGAARILDAHGGALYVTDRSGKRLMPAYIAKGCPPLVDVPPHDLQIAREIQRILLPDEAPTIEGFEIAGLNIPASQVSGDYFDYIKVDEERLGVAIADVSGKGVPASLIMAICRSVLRSQAPENPSPAEVLQKVNRQLYPDIKEDMFISMAYLVLDHSRNGVTLARAGHDAPLLYKRVSQTVTPLKPPGMVVGIDSGNVFDRITGDFPVPLERDDCLVLYTDGVTEALDTDGNEFGVERTVQSVRASADNGAQAIVARLIDDLRNFVGSHPQNDDITLIAIRKT